MIFIFSTAATCNLCGISVNTGEATVENTEGKAETGQNATSTTQEQTQTIEETQSTEEPTKGNNPPEIVKIEFGEFDIDSPESPFDFDDINPGFLPADIFTIRAYDEDNDLLTYNAYDNLGKNFDVSKIDNNNAEFRWSPTQSHLGPYSLNMKVSDDKGGIDTYSIDMTFVDIEWPSDTIDETENNPPVISDELTIIGPVGEVTDLYTNQVFEISVSVYDPDEDYPLTYNWSSEFGEFHTDTTLERVRWKTPPTAGDYVISLTVSDSRGVSSTQNFTVTIQEH
jgi:hypothetical protein